MYYIIRSCRTGRPNAFFMRSSLKDAVRVLAWLMKKDAAKARPYLHHHYVVTSVCPVVREHRTAHGGRFFSWDQRVLGWLTNREET